MRRLGIVICTGIYPPDVGGPATHASDLRRIFLARGHSVTVLSAGERAEDEPGEVVRFPRSASWPRRMIGVVRWLRTHRGRFDVVYATGMQLPALIGARMARRPVAVKIVGDPAWERGRRLGLVDESFEPFQARRSASLRVRLMRAARDWWAARADAVTVPSEFLRRVVVGWGVPADSITTIPNGVTVPQLEGESGAAGDSLRLVYVGRLVAHKRVDLILDAVSMAPAVALEIIGDGPEIEPLKRRSDRLRLSDRVEFVGVLGHDQVLERLIAADALVLASEYEGLPHVVVEALACGTPVVSPPVGGVGEVVDDDVNGIILGDLSAEALSRVSARLADDRELLTRLRRGAQRSGEGFGIERCAERLESLLAELVSSDDR